ncbi:hypothetical protein bcgnr5369_68270 [Bacillus cereus]
MQNYVACGEDEGNTIKGKFVAKPGKYYLNVHKFDDKNGEYSLMQLLIMTKRYLLCGMLSLILLWMMFGTEMLKAAFVGVLIL